MKAEILAKIIALNNQPSVLDSVNEFNELVNEFYHIQNEEERQFEIEKLDRRLPVKSLKILNGPFILTWKNSKQLPLFSKSVKKMGRTVAEAEDLFRRVQAMVTSRPDTPVDAGGLGKLVALAGVRSFPARVKCASLAWHTLHAALQGRETPVSTESPSD